MYLCIVEGWQEVNRYDPVEIPDGISVLLEGQQVGSEVCLFVLYSHLLSNTVSVSFDRFSAYVHKFCYLFGGLAVLDQIGYPNFCGCEAQILLGQPAGKW